MKTIFLSIFVFLYSICNTSYAQIRVGATDVLDVRYITKIAQDVESFKVDRFGNVYYIDTKNVLNKFEPKIKRYTKYADLKSGKIASVDVTNPLRVVVFYEDQSVVKFLDVNLTEINSFQIRTNYAEGWISLVASSNNNGLWMYDNINRKIIKLGEQLNTQFSSGDLYLVLSKKINPVQLIENADELFLIDTTKGTFVFDLFGGYKRTISSYDEFLNAKLNSHERLFNPKYHLRSNKELIYEHSDQ